MLAAAFRATSNDMIPLIFVAAIVFSAIGGFANAWLIAKRGVSPFLATLATMIILQGAWFANTGGAPISTLPPGMRTLATGRALGLPINLWTLAAMAVALSALLHKSRFGREIYMAGGKAARLVASRRIAWSLSATSSARSAPASAVCSFSASAPSPTGSARVTNWTALLRR